MDCRKSADDVFCQVHYELALAEFDTPPHTFKGRGVLFCVACGGAYRDHVTFARCG